MSQENKDGGGFKGEIVILAREMAAGVRDGLLMPLNLARSFHERWGIRGVLGALGITAMSILPSFALAWDVPRGALLAALSLPAGGVINRLEILYFRR